MNAHDADLRYALFLRRGIPGEESRPADAAQWDVPPVSTHTYRVSSSRPERWAEFVSGTESLVVLADAFVLSGPIQVRKALQLFARIPTLAAVTLASPALHSVLGLEQGVHAHQGLRRRIVPLPLPPSWFCVARREALVAGFRASRRRTLEFALLDAAAAWARQGLSVARLDVQTLEFDARAWVTGLLSRSAPDLAEDFAAYSSEPGEGRLPVPPQFRVCFHGDYVRQAPADPEPHAAPLFSLLCPAYKPAFFKEMLDSVLAQSWPDWELVVRIDGPPAGDAARLSALLDACAGDPRIRWTPQANLGTGPTRAKLATEARGAFLVCVDDDDMLPPNALEEFARAIAARPDAGVFRGGTRLFGLVDQYLRPRPRMTIDGMSCDLFEVNQPFAIRRSVYEMLGGFHGDPHFGGAGEDSDFFLRADRADVPAVLIDAPLYLRRISTHNQSLLYTGEHFKAHLRSLVRAHAPAGWRLEETHFREYGAFIAQTLTLAQETGPARIHCPTAYFDYYTLGKSSHTVIDLELTSLCTADCVFCPRDALRRRTRFLDVARVERLAAQLRDSGERRRVVLCGVGESVLHPRLVEIVGLLSAAGAEVAMTSNGVHLPVELFRRLEEHGLTQLNVSVNAATDAAHRTVMRTGKLARVRRNLCAILDDARERCSPVEINVSFVLCAENRHEVDAFVACWRDTGVSQIFIHPLNNRAGLLDGRAAAVDPGPVARAYAHDPRVIVDLFEFPRENEDICSVAQSVVFVTVDGDVPVCVLDYGERHLVGHIDRESLQRLHLNKIARYRRGEFMDLCGGCTFCPPRFRRRGS